MGICSLTAIMVNKAEFFAQQIVILYILIGYIILLASMELKISKSSKSLKSKDLIQA